MTNLLGAASLLALTVAAGVKTVSADVVLNEKIMNLALEAGKLSALAYEENPPPEKEFDNFGYFDAEPDQALAVKINGYCYGAFRGTTLTFSDWGQNIKLGKKEVCQASEPDGEDCCQSRSGFYEGYWTSYKEEFEQSMRDCAKSCSNLDECVVLTGHSQGGAIAAVAALLLADLNPYVITFGQPNTIDAPCELISSTRWYRFVNTKKSSHVGLMYDPVPFVPGLGADSFGHMLLLSNDHSGATVLAYIGLDVQDKFGPLNVDGFQAHSMISNSSFPGYLDRVEALMANASYPLTTAGYPPHSICTQDKECETENCASETHFSFKRCVGVDCTKDDDCPKTGRCDSGICLPKLGSCEGCDEDSDCAGGKCLLFKCSGSDGLMDENCICRTGGDCGSGRCEGAFPPTCEAQLAIDAFCNEDSDCKSDYCSWHFKCAQKSRAPPPEESDGEKNIGLIVGLSVGGAALLVLVLGYFFGTRFMGWIRGYEEVNTSDA